MPPAQSERKRRVLFLSNGHAEDLIAATIIEKLIGECFYCEIRALPLVGDRRCLSSSSLSSFSQKAYHFSSYC